MKFLGIRKRSWKKILTVGLSVLLIVGAVAGCVALFGKDTKTIGAAAFSRGDINAMGEFVECSTSICTKEAFPCQGLRISPDFEANGEFEVHFYNVNGKWLGSSGKQDAVYNGDFPAAAYARVVYYPEKPSDVKASEWKIGVLDVITYAKQLTITVAKEQVEYKSSSNLYVRASQVGSFTMENIEELTTNANVQASALVTLDDKYDFYMVYVKLDEASSVDTDVAFGFGSDGSSCVYLGDDGKNKDGFAYIFTGNDMIEGCWYSVVVEVPHDASVLRIQGPVAAEYQIYGVELK